MTEATTVTHCCQDGPTTDGRRLSDVCLGIHVKNRVEELPAIAPDVAADVLPRSLEGTPYTLRIISGISNTSS